MFLSRIEFQPRRRSPESVDLYSVHELLWKAFPGQPRGSRPFLFRADIETPEDEKPRLVCLVQSTLEPDWKLLGESGFHAQLKDYNPVFEAGRRLRFLLRANPTVSRKGRAEPAFKELEGEAFKEKRGKRHGLRDEKEQRDWLRRKGAEGGFEVGEDFVATNRRPWKWRDAGRSGSHDGVDFQGVLRVTDAERFAQVVRSGIGSAKGLGFGLLSLAPA